MNQDYNYKLPWNLELGIWDLGLQKSNNLSKFPFSQAALRKVCFPLIPKA